MATTINSNNKVMNASLTKRGLVSIWEAGGGMSNTGNATIVAKPDGTKPTAVYIRKKGMLACDEHALIPVHVGYLVIESYQHHHDFTHQIWKVIRTFTDGQSENPQGKIEVALVNKFDNGEWDAPLADNLKAAVAAAEEKATAYHCRYPVYVVEKEKKD